jgi:hypothetical protein
MPVQLRSMLLRDFTSFSLVQFSVHAMKVCRGRKDTSPLIRNAVVERIHGTHRIGGSVGPRALLDGLQKRKVSLLLGILSRMVRPVA